MAHRRSRSRKRRHQLKLPAIGLAAIAIAGVLLLALRGDPRAVQAPSIEPAQSPLLLDGSFGARFAGEMIASKQGLFPPDVTLRVDPDDPDFVGTVARKHAIGVTSGQKFLLAAWRGAAVTAFAGSLLDTPVAIFTLESSGLRRPTDLVDKRIGYRKGGEGEVIFDAMMAQLGLPRSRIVKVPDRDNFDALRAGEVDAIVADIDDQPSPSSTARLNVIKPQDYAIHVPGLVYFASRELIHDRPSLITQVLQGVIKGWQLTYGDYARSVPIIAGFESAALDPGRVRFELEQQRALVLGTGMRIADYDESRWNALRDILLFARLGDEDVPLSQAVDYQFLRDVYRRSPDIGTPGAWSPQN